LWTAAYRGRIEVVKILLVAGAGRSLFVCDNNHGETPLEAANRHGHTGIVYELFRAGVDDWLKKRRSDPGP
jgi:ankyrin repeat protein